MVGELNPGKILCTKGFHTIGVSGPLFGVLKAKNALGAVVWRSSWMTCQEQRDRWIANGRNG